MNTSTMNTNEKHYPINGVYGYKVTQDYETANTQVVTDRFQLANDISDYLHDNESNFCDTQKIYTAAELLPIIEGMYPGDEIFVADLTIKAYDNSGDFCEEAYNLKTAIMALANNEDALDNFCGYLSMHFESWLNTWGDTPAGLADEFLHFSQI